MGLKGATCDLRNNKGAWKIITPATIGATGSSEDLLVQCEAEGHSAGKATVVSSLKAEIFGNILIGGLIGVAIDHASGSGYSYPNLINVKMGNSVRVEHPRTGAVGANQEADRSQINNQASDNGLFGCNSSTVVRGQGRTGQKSVDASNPSEVTGPVFSRIVKHLKENDQACVTFSSLLLDSGVISDAEAQDVLKYEQIMENMAKNSAFALAVSPSGRISTGRAWARKSSSDANSIALKWCMQTDGISPIGNCAVVMRSGGWDRQGLIEVFETIPEEAAENWKEAFLKAVRGRVTRIEKNAS